MIESGSKTEQVISALDLLPTLTAVAGISHDAKKPLDGADMWPAIRDGKTMPRPAMIVGAQGSVAILRDQWKLIRGADGEFELYDFIGDPGESTNRIEEKPDSKLSFRFFHRL